MITTNNTFPVFQTGQLLTSDSLNGVREFLDENLRSNRSNLNGLGVVCGFDVSFDAGENGTQIPTPSITVSKGLAITSDGYFISLEADQTFTFLQEDFIDRANYSFFRDSNGDQFDIRELVVGQTGCPLADILPEVDQRVVVLYLEEIQELQEFCVTNDGDFGSSTMSFNLRVLLVKKEDLDAVQGIFRSLNIVRKEDTVSKVRVKRLSGAVNGLLSEILPEPDPVDPPVEGEEPVEPVVVPLLSSLASVSSADQLQRAYESIINDTLDQENGEVVEVGLKRRLGEALLTFFNGTETSIGYRSFLAVNFNDLSPTEDFNTFINSRLINNEQLATGDPAIEANSGFVYGQYAYGYLRNLVESFNELCDTAYEAFKDCITDDNTIPLSNFPLHVMLGSLVPTATDVLNLDSDGKDRFRHVLTQKFIVEGKEQRIAKAQLLFERIIRQILTFEIPLNADIVTLLTPSKSNLFPVSDRAIPYYYNITSADFRLYNVWNPVFNLRGIIDENVLGYRLQSNAPGSVRVTIPGQEIENPQVTSPTDYDLKEIDFFRIEGHIGRLKSTVEAEINAIKRNSFVDFDIVTTSFGDIEGEPDDDGFLPSIVQIDLAVDNYDFDLFHHLVDQYPGMEHLGGVANGGTLILVCNENDVVVADFALPSQNVLV